jgi:hypothetical protein
MVLARCEVLHALIFGECRALCRIQHQILSLKTFADKLPASLQ